MKFSFFVQFVKTIVYAYFVGENDGAVLVWFDNGYNKGNLL